MNLIGIHDGHNSAVCLFIDGEIKGLMQEERLLSQKNYSGFQVRSLNKMLTVNNLSLANIDAFVFSGKHSPLPSENGGIMAVVTPPGQTLNCQLDKRL